MRRNLSYPKDGERKLRETIKDLKREVSRLRKECELLREGRDPEQHLKREKRPKVDRVKDEKRWQEFLDEKEDPGKTMSLDEWRKDFSKKFKPKTAKPPREPTGNEED